MQKPSYIEDTKKIVTCSFAETIISAIPPLISIVKKGEALLIDSRYSPFSRHTGYSQRVISSLPRVSN